MSEPTSFPSDNPDVYFISILNALAHGKALTSTEAESAFGLIMDGTRPPEQVAAFLMGLRVRGERFEEVLGAVTALRRRMIPVLQVPVGTMDVCGTGGDNYGTLNVSTAVAFVLAALGVPVAKHGNRAVSSRSGASDVLQALGVPLLSDPEELSRQLALHKLAFLAAPHHHPAMRHAAPVRKALGIRTLFNLLGPMVNPAGVKRQLVGVFAPEWLPTVVNVLHQLGSEHVWAVCGEPDGGEQGIDELTLAGPTRVLALEKGTTHSFTVHPEMAGLSYAPVQAIQGGDAQYNAKALETLLHGAHGAYRDTVLLNAACALHVAGRRSILKGLQIDPQAFRECVADVSRVLDNGAALAVLNGLRTSSSGTHAQDMTG